MKAIDLINEKYGTDGFEPMWLTLDVEQIIELMEAYHQQQLKFLNMPVVSNNEVVVCCETCANFISNTKLCNKTCLEYSAWRKAN